MKYDKIRTICDNCHVINILYIIKAWFIATFFEIALSIFALGSILFYTDFFVVELIEQKIIVFMSMPVAIAAFVSIFYVVFSTYFFMNRIIKSVHIVKTDESLSVKLLSLEKAMRGFFVKAHIVAFILFPTVTALSVHFILPKYIVTERNTIATIVLSCVSVLFGLLWILFAYYANKKIDWRKIYKKMESNDSSDIGNYIEQKTKAHIVHFITLVAAFLLFVSCFIFVLMSFRSDVSTTGNSDSVTSTMFFIVSFASLITFSAKNCYDLYFKDEKEKEKPFLTSEEMFK